MKEYSIEGFMKDASLAKEFLCEVESQSFNFVDPEWKDLTEDDLIDRACFTFHIITNEVVHANHLKNKGLIN